MMMNTRLAILLALVCGVAYVNAQLVGGLHDEREADEEVRKVIAQIRQDVDRMAQEEYRSLEPISYRKQIVAGANYFVRALATGRDGSQSHVHLRIYKPFRGPLELSAIRKNLDRSKPLEYFQ